MILQLVRNCRNYLLLVLVHCDVFKAFVSVPYSLSLQPIGDQDDEAATSAAVESDVTTQESPSQEVTSKESETEIKTSDSALSAETTGAGNPRALIAAAVDAVVLGD